MSKRDRLWWVAVALVVAAVGAAVAGVMLVGGPARWGNTRINGYLVSGAGPGLAVLGALCFLAAHNGGPTVRRAAARRVLLTLGALCVASLVLALLQRFGVDTWVNNWYAPSETAALAALGWGFWRPMPWFAGTRIALALAVAAAGMVIAGLVHGWVDAAANRAFGDQFDQLQEGSSLLFGAIFLAVLALAFSVYSRQSPEWSDA